MSHRLVQIKLLENFSGAIDPKNLLTPQFDSDVGVDLYSSEALVIHPGETRLVPTGMSIEVPIGVDCQIRPRSGLAAHYNITVLNSPGTIDPAYRGEIKVLLHRHINGQIIIGMLSILEQIEKAAATGKHPLLLRNSIQALSKRLYHDGFKIEEGDRIAQMVFSEHVTPVPHIVGELSATVRGEGGFGSTG